MSARIEVEMNDLVGCIKDLLKNTDDLFVSLVINDDRQLSLIVKDKNHSDILEYSIWHRNIQERPTKRNTTRLYFNNSIKLDGE